MAAVCMRDITAGHRQGVNLLSKRVVQVVNLEPVIRGVILMELKEYRGRVGRRYSIKIVQRIEDDRDLRIVLFYVTEKII